MKHSLSLLVLLLFLFSNSYTFANQQKPSLFEFDQVNSIPIKNTFTGAQYELYIKLPDAYSSHPDKAYPVIYLTDAKYHIPLFSVLTKWLLSDVILVGISWQKDNQGILHEQKGERSSRFRDYTFKQSSDIDKQKKYQFGGADNHLAFIRNDVIKYVEKNYRADPKSRAYFGYSLGGLFGAYTLMVQPNTFKYYMLGSPSIWQHTPALKQLLTKNQNSHLNLFISYGIQEKKLGGYIKSFITMLKDQKDKQIAISFTDLEGEHSVNFPITAVESATWLAHLLKEKEGK
jgi:predicted alpha/beta superfamily hydrolase